MSVAEQLQYQERCSSVRLFEERAAALATGVNLLEGGIAESHRQVRGVRGVRGRVCCLAR